jgi:hypothetical protein
MEVHMVHRLAAIAGRIRRALALLIVGAIAGAIIGELVGRARDAWAAIDEMTDVAAWIGGGMPPPGPRPRGTSDWYAARRLADEAELVRLQVPPTE